MCDSLETFANAEQTKLKSFAFKVLDYTNDKQLSEIDLFQTMQCLDTRITSNGSNNDKDVFLEVFAEDFVKIVQMIKSKKGAGELVAAGSIGNIHMTSNNNSNE